MYQSRIIVVVLAAFCLAQGFEARVVEPKLSINDIIAKISEVVEKFEDIISELIVELEIIIDHIKYKLREVINQVNIDKTVEELDKKLKEKIEEIIATSGVDLEVIKECIANETKTETDVIDDTFYYLNKCKQSSAINDLEEELEALKEEVRDLERNAKDIIFNCFVEHPYDEIAIASCLKHELVALKKNADAIIKQLKETIVFANETLQNVVHDYKKCVARVVADTVEEQNDIINDFKECVASHSEK